MRRAIAALIVGLALGYHWGYGDGNDGRRTVASRGSGAFRDVEGEGRAGSSGQADSGGEPTVVLSAMDNLDRMYRHLVRTIRSRFPQYLSQPFDVGELHQTILPYRHHRRELGIDTNEDYEITLSQLLAGDRNYLIVDDRMHDVLKAEMASTNPDPSKFKQFASARVALSPAALRSLSVGPDEDVAAAASMPTMEIPVDVPPSVANAARTRCCAASAPSARPWSLRFRRQHQRHSR